MADGLEECFTAPVADGFVLAATHVPGTYVDFVKWVVPELQRRGLYHKDYTGATLRENLGLPIPRATQVGPCRTAPPLGEGVPTATVCDRRFSIRPSPKAGAARCHRAHKQEATMIYELRTYTFHAGKLPAYLKLQEEVGRPVRGDDYGKCHGYWTAEFGQLNQVWHLWSYASLDDRAQPARRVWRRTSAGPPNTCRTSGRC